MIVFNRKYILKRSLKKRRFKTNKYPRLKYGTIGLYCLYQFRFEYTYCLFFRKFFKKFFKRLKRKIVTQKRKKMWMFIRPNYILTKKSKHARMGKGKGGHKRWCTLVYPGRVFIEHINISYKQYKRYHMKMCLKLKLHLKIITNTEKMLKKFILTTLTKNNSSVLNINLVRKNIQNVNLFNLMIY